MNEDTDINFNTLIGHQIEIKERWQKTLNEIEKRNALGNKQASDRLAIAEAKQNIKFAEDAITDLNKQRSEYSNAEKQEKTASSIAEEKALINKLIEQNNLGYLVKENKYAYCMGMEETNANLVNPIFEFVEASKFGRVLNKMAGKQLKLGTRVLADELADYFQQINKDYYMTTCSFNKDKWGKNKVYNKANTITKFWVMPDLADHESYDKRFDFLIRCVGGGKKENMDHLEKWLGYKYLNPDKVANTPNLDIGGYPGGNGKGRYIELAKTIFTNPCVQPAALKELMDGFNGNWELAVMLYYDEPKQDELPEGKLKQATGGEDLRIERKGVDATVADRNYNIVFVSNNPNGVVTLSGTGSSGEDRRYSVMTTSLVMVDEAIKLGMTQEQAKVYVNEINNLIKNRTEVAKWLAHVIMKHNIADISVLQPLHGNDYHARSNDQKSALDVAFDKMLPVFIRNEILPYEVLKQVIITLTGYEKLSDKKLKQDWKRYLEKSKVAATYLEGTSRPKIEYTWQGNDNLSTVKTIYQLDNTKKREFDLSTILKKKPVNIKLYRESFESATSELLTIGED